MVSAVHTARSQNILLNWRAVFALFAAGVALVWGAGLLQDILRFAGGAGLSDPIWIIDADSEESLQTWISIALLYSAAWILFSTGQEALRKGEGAVVPWFFLSVLFGIVSFDEFYGLHERLSAILSSRIDGGGIFYFAWAAPLGLVAVMGLVALMPFLNSLGRRTGSLALLSAVLYLTGAVGMEMIAGLVVEELGRDTFAYRLLVNIEEGLEMTGVLLFLYTLLRHREGTAEYGGDRRLRRVASPAGMRSTGE